MILVIYAHPYPSRSRACRALLDAFHGLPNTELRSLYDLYPDYDIDVTTEQNSLARASLVVWLHPFYWYSVPAMLKHWFDKVLERNWAYGNESRALYGKHCLWITTTGGDMDAYSTEGQHEQRFENFIAPIEETARFCGMNWETPFIVHDAHSIDDAGLSSHAQQLRARLEEWLATQSSKVNQAAAI